MQLHDLHFKWYILIIYLSGIYTTNQVFASFDALIYYFVLIYVSGLVVLSK